LLTPPAQLSRLDVSQQRILARLLRQALAGSAADEGGHDHR
jgi:hypothetical protein